MELRSIIHPSTKALVVLILLNTALLVTVFGFGWEGFVYRPVLLALPFYTLVVTFVYTYDRLHPHIHEVKEWFISIPIVDRICSIPLVERYRLDILFKSKVRLYFSIAINIGYIAVNVLAYNTYHSKWFLVIAGYYVILFGMCIVLFRFDQKVGFGFSRMDDLRITRLCALILLTLNVILLIAVEMIIYTDAGYQYEGVLIYLMALYTLFTSGLATINLIRVSKYRNYVVTIIRMAVVAAALVSILALETAVLFQFGADMSEEIRELIVVISGIAISTVIVGMASRIIALTSDEIREMKAEEAEKSE